MRIHLIRHPRPEIDAGICYGKSDIPADAEHCRELAESLAKILPAGIHLISSPLRRCTALALQLAQVMQCAPPVLDARLQEMDFGAWEMQRWDEIPRTEINAWAKDTSHYRPGGGESVAIMAVRVLAFLEDIRLMHADGGGLALICHAGTIRLMLAYQVRISAAEMALQAASHPHALQYGQCLAVDLPAFPARR
ncbi:histidine phosphatase family protein [Undibacterium terreum]|uniref:Phosphoglycerate mutase n=1 Tax=Undibacterium terreum TaxID=1224302 RepID=A0A916UGA8_9BURK|nr:histidine phosphatase family protein [Undibacterium terreum]GGC72514.1 phosphoglycerate mutase [Undibacterium terreum]